MEVNKASYETLLRVPGIGVKGAKKIITARRTTSLTFQDLKRLGVVLKRAQYFLLCKGKMMEGVKVSEDMVLRVHDVRFRQEPLLPISNAPERGTAFVL